LCYSSGSRPLPAGVDADCAGRPAETRKEHDVVEFVGMIGTRHVSEIRPAAGPVIDPAFVTRFARAHERGGFDRVLIGYGSSDPDGAQVAAHVAARTERLGLLIAHRPGFVFPTLAARTFATLDHFSGGRVAVHVITGGNDADQRREGDFLAKDERYARTDEYLQVLRRAWEEGPFDHEGRFYRLSGFATDVRPVARIPVYFGGSSAAALRVGSRHADVYAFWGEPLAETAEQIAAVRAAATSAGRTTPPGISVSFRPILGPTDDAAWERAHRILATIRGRGPQGSFVGMTRRRTSGGPPENEGSRRLLAAAARGARHDRALWMPTAAATSAAGNTTALVGSPETVAQALLDYVDIGVTTLLIRGFDPLDDAIDYGRHLIPLVRAELARRSCTVAR
jgi:alkanesulfonate monooxygenase